MSEFRHFEIGRLDDEVVVLRLKVPRLFDTLVVSELEDDLLSYLEQESPRHVVVNFERVVHCSTAVINGLLRAKKRLVNQGGSLWLCGMADVIRDSYRVLNLDGTVFHICPTVRDALREIASRRAQEQE